MNVVELLKHVRALPAREWETFLIALLESKENAPRRKRQTKCVKWPDIEARARRIFGDRVLPNLVLLEREEEAP